MSEEQKPDVSPTGKPMFQLPPWAMYILGVVFTSCGFALTMMDLSPKETKVVMGIGIIAAGALGTTPGFRKALVLLLALPLLHGCSTTHGFLVTGDSLHEVKNQYVLTSEALRRGAESGTVSKETFSAWVEFSNRFEIFFEKAVEAFLAAQAITDDFSAKRIEEALARIGLELLGWFNKAKAAGLLPQGAP